MELEWIYNQDQEITIKEFLAQQNLPKAFLKTVKFDGDILLNHLRVPMRYNIRKGDHLRLIAPVERGHDTVPPSQEPINIIYEDQDLLILNKQVGVVSIPSLANPAGSIANRVRGYYQRQGYSDQVIHIVTRLDRDTSGLMLIAKHRLAHALLDQQVRAGQVLKYYHALTSRNQWPDHGVIEAPIARTEASIITRRVHESGKYAKTEYWCQQIYPDGAYLRLRLHTGRTHQIRVHLMHMKGPLIGDDLYGGPLTNSIQRQALHCGELKFIHPITQEPLHFIIPLPQDMQNWMQAQEIDQGRKSYGSI
ncbi:RluA family pseudouridine synthase [Facklamia miroungae]|uniref:Pseudouridine synthase n=1 Tax=Facklamia miroungae TaxID=120956 RepID=A0A1G7UJN2_9LACT|nr:RluA family pseudouridine synthase [Facklamia miroungae]NKZ30076.1 RluA family pseudouridine synthase [Facklamia miroungae]SDG47746.1 23S rRNA pseudouridine1911/1915/1917 synthase [Facklamia miroungae]